MAAVVLIVASTGYSLLILHSDAEFADFGRDALYRLISRTLQQAKEFGTPGSTGPTGMLRWLGRHLPSRVVLSQSPEICWWWTIWPTEIIRLYSASRIEHWWKRYPTSIDSEEPWELEKASTDGFWLWGFGESEKDRFELWRID